MCNDIDGQRIPCGGRDDHNFVELCQDHTDRLIEDILTEYPILRGWTPSPDLPSCCQRDEIADAADWDAAYAWGRLAFLRGEL